MLLSKCCPARNRPRGWGEGRRDFGARSPAKRRDRDAPVLCLAVARGSIFRRQYSSFTAESARPSASGRRGSGGGGVEGSVHAGSIHLCVVAAPRSVPARHVNLKGRGPVRSPTVEIRHPCRPSSHFVSITNVVAGRLCARQQHLPLEAICWGVWPPPTLYCTAVRVVSLAGRPPWELYGPQRVSCAAVIG